MEASLKPTPTKVATKWAFFYLIASIVLTYVFQFINLDPNSPIKYVSMLVFIVFLILSQVEFKEKSGGFLTFSEGFSTGFRYAVFGGLLVAVFTFIYLSYLSPDMLTKAMEAQRTQLEAKGLSEEQIDKAIEITTKYGPVMGSFGSAVFSAICGAIISLISAAVLKKEPAPFDMPPPADQPEQV